MTAWMKITDINYSLHSDKHYYFAIDRNALFMRPSPQLQQTFTRHGGQLIYKKVNT